MRQFSVSRQSLLTKMLTGEMSRRDGRAAAAAPGDPIALHLIIWPAARGFPIV
jgi:hypothetical protein